LRSALQRLEPFSCPEFGLPLASGASRCSAPQPGTVYLLHYTRPRTVAEHLQAPAEDSAFPACVNHRPAPL